MHRVDANAAKQRQQHESTRVLQFGC